MQCQCFCAKFYPKSQRFNGLTYTTKGSKVLGATYEIRWPDLGGTVSGTVVVEFDELITISVEIAKKLDTKPRRELMSMIESFIIAKATDKDKVQLRVKKGQEYLWSKAVQDAIDNALANRSGKPAELQIVYV